jgi:hypothetical protein
VDDGVDAVKGAVVDALVVDRLADLVVARSSSDHGDDVVTVGLEPE